jgi:hypothetical protein
MKKTIQVEEDLHLAFKIECAKKGVTMQSKVEQMINRSLVSKEEEVDVGPDIEF